MKIVFILMFFAHTGLVCAQKKMDACKANFYNGKIIQYYAVYNIDSVTEQKFEIDANAITEIRKKFNSEKTINAIRKIKSNPLFIDLISEYASTSEYDSQTLYTFSQMHKKSKDYKPYIKNYTTIDCLISKTLKEYPNILNIALYSYIEDFGDCFFYQKGYDNFDFTMISSPVLISVLYGFDEFEIKNYKHNLVGFEARETGQIITIPIVIEEKYVCDIRIMLCDN